MTDSLGPTTLCPGQELSLSLTCMTRVIRYRNYGVYVHDERGCPHHSPHAHIQMRRTRVCSVHLVTLTLFNQMERVPAALIDLIAEHQDALLEEWERLNT